MSQISVVSATYAYLGKYNNYCPFFLLQVKGNTVTTESTKNLDSSFMLLCFMADIIRFVESATSVVSATIFHFKVLQRVMRKNDFIIDVSYLIYILNINSSENKLGKSLLNSNNTYNYMLNLFSISFNFYRQVLFPYNFQYNLYIF